MSVKYIIKQHYPSLPKDFTPGTVLFRYAPIVGFVYYSDIYDKVRISKNEVEDNPNFFEKFHSGIAYGDTFIVGIGNQKIDPPYLYKTAEENNK